MKKSDHINILDINGLTDTKFRHDSVDERPFTGVCVGCGYCGLLLSVSYESGIHYCSDHCRVKKECPSC